MVKNLFVRAPQTFLSPEHGLDPSRLIDTLTYKYNFRKENPDYFVPSGTLVFCGSQGEGKTLSGVDYVLNVLRMFPYCILVTNTEIMGYPPNAYINKVIKTDVQWKQEYMKIEPQRRDEWYENVRHKLREHYKYSNSRLTEEEYIDSNIILYPFNRRSDFNDWKAENEWEILSLLDNSKITIDTMREGIHTRVCIQYWGLDTLKYVSNGKFGVLYFIDEIHLELNSLESKNIDVSIMVEISQQRKQRKHIVGTSQRYTRMAKPLREQIRDCVICKNFFGCIQYNKLIDGDSSEEKDGKLVYETRRRILFFHSPLMYLMYDTFAKMRRYNNEWQGRGRDPFFDMEVSYNGSS